MSFLNCQALPIPGHYTKHTYQRKRYICPLSKPWRYIGEGRIYLSLFLTSALHVNGGVLSAIPSGRFPPGKYTSTNWTWHWVGPIASLRNYENRIISHFCRNLNSQSSSPTSSHNANFAPPHSKIISYSQHVKQRIHRYSSIIQYPAKCDCSFSLALELTMGNKWHTFTAALIRDKMLLINLNALSLK